MRSDQLKEELKTIQDRTITIRLSDADCVRLAEKAGSVNLSVGDLLKYFVSDLICGTQSNGSDERDLAEQWFERVGFEQLADNTFLRWLIRYDDVREFIGHYDLMKECEDDLTSDDPSDSREANQQEIAYQKEWLEDVYHEYATDLGSEKWVEPYDAAVERVLRWDKELRDLKGDLWQCAYDKELEQKRAMIAKIFEVPSDQNAPSAMPLQEIDHEPEM